MVHYVYILKCQDNSVYTGITDAIKKRLQQHLHGESKSTKYRLPVKLMCFIGFPNKYLAARFEQYLKSHSGRAFLKRHLVDYSSPKRLGKK